MCNGIQCENKNVDIVIVVSGRRWTKRVAVCDDDKKNILKLTKLPEQYDADKHMALSNEWHGIMNKERQKGRTLGYIVMVIYLIFLCWLILFKLADSIDKIPSRRGINFIPFYYDQLAGTKIQMTDILYNVLVFVPAGFYFSAFGKKKFISGIILSAMLSLCFEILQFIFALGSSDITDLITNIAGGVLGTGMYYVAEKIFKGKGVWIVSITGALLEVMLIVLIAVLIFFKS